MTEEEKRHICEERDNQTELMEVSIWEASDVMLLITPSIHLLSEIVE